MLGLDMLKRYQSCVDLRENVLRIGDEVVPFLVGLAFPSILSNHPWITVATQGSMASIEAGGGCVSRVSARCRQATRLLGSRRSLLAVRHCGSRLGCALTRSCWGAHRARGRCRWTSVSVGSPRYRSCAALCYPGTSRSIRSPGHSAITRSIVEWHASCVTRIVLLLGVAVLGVAARRSGGRGG